MAALQKQVKTETSAAHKSFNTNKCLELTQ